MGSGAAPSASRSQRAVHQLDPQEIEVIKTVLDGILLEHRAKLVAARNESGIIFLRVERRWPGRRDVERIVLEKLPTCIEIHVVPVV